MFDCQFTSTSGPVVSERAWAVKGLRRMTRGYVHAKRQAKATKFKITANYPFCSCQKALFLNYVNAQKHLDHMIKKRRGVLIVPKAISSDRDLIFIGTFKYGFFFISKERFNSLSKIDSKLFSLI